MQCARLPVGGNAGRVGGADKVGELRERETARESPRRVILVPPDVDRRAEGGVALEMVEEGLLVDRSCAPDVDEDRPGAHGAEDGGVDRSLGELREGPHLEDDVPFRNGLREPLRRVHFLAAGGGGARSVEAQHPHFEPRETLGDRPADLPVPEYHRGSTVECPLIGSGTQPARSDGLSRRGEVPCGSER